MNARKPFRQFNKGWTQVCVNPFRKGDKDSERWHPTVRDGSAQRDHGKHRVGFSITDSQRRAGEQRKRVSMEQMTRDRQRDLRCTATSI